MKTLREMLKTTKPGVQVLVKDVYDGISMEGKADALFKYAADLLDRAVIEMNVIDGKLKLVTCL